MAALAKWTWASSARPHRRSAADFREALMRWLQKTSSKTSTFRLLSHRQQTLAGPIGTSITPLSAAPERWKGRADRLSLPRPDDQPATQIVNHSLHPRERIHTGVDRATKNVSPQTSCLTWLFASTSLITIVLGCSKKAINKN